MNKFSRHSFSINNLPTFLLVIILVGVLGFFNACKKDNPTDDKPVIIPTDTSSTKSSAVFILNEGNFQWGNSSISLLDLTNNTITNNVFSTINNRPLGDVAQSMEIFNDKAYVVVNNSSKIEVLNPSTFQSIGVIQNLVSPRYFLGVNSSKGYVTDLWSNKVSVIDLNSNMVVKSIAINGWTEELALANNHVFVTNINNKYLYVVNSTNDMLVDSIEITYGSNSIQIDKNNKLWVLCSGNSDSSSLAALYRINPSNFTIEKTFNFPMMSESPNKLRINGTKDTLYYLNKGVNRFCIHDSTLNTNSFIAENGIFYGLGIDPKSGVLYVSDAIDYVQKGIVYRYNPSNGVLINSYKVGIIPSAFCFK